MKEESRQQMTQFLAELMKAVQAREWEDTARLSAFGMTTLLTTHFPGLISFLAECLVRDEDTKCLEGTVNVERFLFHLNALKVCCFILAIWYFIILFSRISTFQRLLHILVRIP